MHPMPFRIRVEKGITTYFVNDEELFLMNGFKTMFSSKLVSIISEWLNQQFMVIYRSDAMQLIRKFTDPKKKSIYVEKTLTEAAKTFGINSNALGYVVDGDNTEAKLCSIFESEGKAIPAELFESYGTIRFVNMFPLVVNALMNGSTLVVDEFDASLHPMALMNIINIFHNDEVNIHHAQLIFNTHNPIYLDGELLRHDQIVMVEKRRNDMVSEIYSLADYKLRPEERILKNYLNGKYGALPHMDLEIAFKHILEREANNLESSKEQ